jgi:hypothetical protein
MKYVSIEKAPRAQEKINAFRNRNENREGKKIRTKTRKSIVARGSKLPAPSSQLPKHSGITLIDSFHFRFK